MKEFDVPLEGIENSRGQSATDVATNCVEYAIVATNHVAGTAIRMRLGLFSGHESRRDVVFKCVAQQQPAGALVPAKGAESLQAITLTI